MKRLPLKQIHIWFLFSILEAEMPKQDGLPAQRCLAIYRASLGEELRRALPGNKPPGLCPGPPHHPFHGSFHEVLSLDDFGSMVLIPSMNAQDMAFNLVMVFF